MNMTAIQVHSIGFDQHDLDYMEMGETVEIAYIVRDKDGGIVHRTDLVASPNALVSALRPFAESVEED